MQVEATTTRALDSGADTVVIGVLEGEESAVDARAGFKRLAVTEIAGSRVIAVGLGAREELDAERMRVAAAVTQVRAAEVGTRTLCWQLPGSVGADLAAAVVQGTLLRAYRFDRFRRGEDDDPAPERLIISSGEDFGAVVVRAAALCEAQNRARDLVNAPSNELTPSALAHYAGALPGVSVSVMDEEEIRAAGMGAFAAIAQGSAEGARLIRLDYEALGSDAPRLAMIGKAVTFDSGGLSIKPAAKMHEMKFDMAGGAAVIEAIATLASMQAPVRVMGLVGATENLPSGSAVKPGDIVTALDGTTIEVNNTDAEGRLVLADCIALARREACERLIDVATLTGGIVTALGSVYAGLFSSDDDWAAAVLAASREAGEPVWRLPLDPRFARMVKGRYAELTNLSERREASPITGAEFLHAFAGQVPWAHLDIAGTAYDVPAEYYGDNGATGFGVRLLVELASRAA